jgi:hypothetical protein
LLEASEVWIGGTRRKPGLMQRSKFALGLCVVVFVFVGRGRAQSPPTITEVSPKQVGPPTLQVTTPANGSIVSPGQSLSVSVTSPTSTPFTQVVVIGEDPIGFSAIQTGVPAQFTITIPADIACREYTLTAQGITASRQNAESDPVQIDVERPDLPVSISALTPDIHLSRPGEASPIQLLATFSDGKILDVTESSKVSYSSLNTKVFTIDAKGIVTAVAPGQGVGRTTYTLVNRTVQARIAISIPPPALAPSAYSLSFGNQNVGTSRGSQHITLTNITHGPLRIISLETTGDFSEEDNCTSSSPLSETGTCTVNVTFAPSTRGLRAGKLTIFDSFSAVPLRIPMTGMGN